MDIDQIGGPIGSIECNWEEWRPKGWSGFGVDAGPFVVMRCLGNDEADRSGEDQVRLDETETWLMEANELVACTTVEWKSVG